MDLTRAVSYRGANLNTVEPTVGKPGIIGCMVERADISDIGYVQFAEKRRVADGMDAIEPYTAIHRLSLTGTVFGQTRGEAFDALQVLRRTFSPTEALRESPSTKGFLPIEFSDTAEQSWPVRPMGLRYQWDAQRSGTNAKTTGTQDAVGLGIRWQADLLVGYPGCCPPEDEEPEEPPPTLTCATSLSAVQTWDSGEFHRVYNPSPTSFSPSLSPVVPSVVISLWAGVNESGAYGHYPTGVSGNFTEWGDNRDGYLFPFLTMAAVGYKAGTGAPGVMTVSWTANAGDGARCWRAIACSFPTSATAPVQVGKQDTTGSTVVLAAPPTPGNVFILARFAETQGFGPPNPPTGWTNIYGPATFVDNIGYQSLQLYYRCIVAGDSASVNVGNANSSHWSFLSEWAIT